MKLNLGCGRTRLDGWVNVDHVKIDGVTDVVVDLDGPALADHFAPDTVDESVGSHVIEHLTRPLDFMGALWSVTKPGGTVTFETPYGTSDDAWEDPTHVRPYFIGSWGYFSQPNYWRAQYDVMDEYDLYGRRVHPSAQCPWHVSDARQALSQVRHDGSPTEASEGLRGGGLFKTLLREGSLSVSSPATDGPGVGGPDQGPAPERTGPVLEGRLHRRDRSPRSVTDHPGASTADGDSSRTTASPVGERSPSERFGAGQFFDELGTLVQDAASRTTSRGLAHLARLLVPERIAATPELGESGCLCTRADYGFRADWRCTSIVLGVDASRWRGVVVEDVFDAAWSERNVVSHMRATLEAVKPAREPLRELQELPLLNFELVG